MQNCYDFDYIFSTSSQVNWKNSNRITGRAFEKMVEIPSVSFESKLICRVRLHGSGWKYLPEFLVSRKLNFDKVHSHSSLIFSEDLSRVHKSSHHSHHKGWATALCGEPIHPDRGISHWKFIVDHLPSNFSLGLGIATRESNLADCIGNDILSLDVYANSGKDKLKIFYNSSPIGQLVIGRTLAKGDVLDFEVDFAPQEDDPAPQLKITWNQTVYIRLKLQFLKIGGFYPAVSIGNFKTAIVVM
eukprot:TRINITY_DN505_c0_g1_i1.p1 TRINITY_DN505_c0_g1~~TRINITY_DN505_c0_g1_i1.p1  ORF type:complete len:244 (+),score=58.97 TRINITY_DN505_c0_g1_i1:826-1557(+)